MPEHLTTLAYALLGLLAQEPRSGYALRKLFAATPMAHYSDSPGSIYPALRRLDALGLVVAKVERGARAPLRRVFRPTPAGRAALRAWIRQPLVADDIVWRAETLTLRFAFMDDVGGEREAVRFLGEFRRLVAAHVEHLEAYAGRASGQMPLSARLALEAGIGMYRARLAWAAGALAEYRTRGVGGAAAGGIPTGRVHVGKQEER